MKRRYFTIPLLLLLLALLVFVQTTSNRIVRPERARVSKNHLEILVNPYRYGMKLSSHRSASGMPYLFCDGLPKTGQKGKILRAQLREKGLEISNQPQTIVLLHGHGSRKEHHLPIAERFCAAGFTCLIPDLPGHGDHPAMRASFGKTEVPTLLEFLSEARQRHHLPAELNLFGLSQGGAIALQLAAADQEQFAAVVIISTFARLSKTMEQTAKRKSVALAALLPLVELDLRLRYDLSPKQIAPSKAARIVNLPVFILHGGEDNFVPPEHGKEIFSKLMSSEKEIRIVPDAGHGNVLAKGELVYADICRFYLAHQ